MRPRPHRGREMRLAPAVRGGSDSREISRGPGDLCEARHRPNI